MTMDGQTTQQDIDQIIHWNPPGRSAGWPACNSVGVIVLTTKRDRVTCYRCRWSLGAAGSMAR